MEILDNSEMDSENTVQLTDTMKEYLTEAAKWTKFMSIVGFVILGLLFCGLVAFAVSSSFFATAFPGMEQLGAAALLLVFVFIFLFYGMLIFIPSWFMFRFGTKTLKSIPTMNVLGIETAFENLKSLFKFYGIFMMVVIGMYSIILLGVGFMHGF